VYLSTALTHLKKIKAETRSTTELNAVTYLAASLNSYEAIVTFRYRMSRARRAMVDGEKSGMRTLVPQQFVMTCELLRDIILVARATDIPARHSIPPDFFRLHPYTHLSHIQMILVCK
jgi:hypothetical protein